MPRVRKTVIYSLGAVIAATAVLWGCNGTDVNDPEASDSLLVVQNVDPAAITSDFTADPNTPLLDDVVTIEVKNINRSQGTSSFFGDIFISSFDIACATAGLSASGIPSSLTIPAESTATIEVLIISAGFKAMNPGLIGTSDICRINFSVPT